MIRPFDLNLRHLRAVAAIVDHGSMAAAAETVSLSQPALTQGLAKLERQLGRTLFERRTDGMRPTHEGARIAQRVQAALRQLAWGVGPAPRRGRGFGRAELLMTATQLRAYLAFADAGSFVGAAADAGLSQPAIHRAVRDLEQLCGRPLAERRGRGVTLTLAGRRLARGVRLAAGEIAAALAEIEPGEAGGRLVIGAMPLSRALILPRAIARFTAEWPHVPVEVVEGSWRDLVEPLRDGVIDLMIGAQRSRPSDDLCQIDLLTDRLQVIARAGHPLAGQAAVPLDALRRFPWIVGQRGTPLLAHWRTMIAGDAPPPAPIVCGSVMTIRGLLVESDFLTLLSFDQVAVEVASGILAVIDHALPGGERRIALSTRADWRPTPAQRRFVALARAVSADGLPENE